MTNSIDSARITRLQQTINKRLAKADELLQKAKSGKLELTPARLRDILFCTFRLFTVESAPVGRLWLGSSGRIVIGPEADDLTPKQMTLVLSHLLAHILLTARGDQVGDPVYQNAICAYSQLSTCPIKNESVRRYGFFSLEDVGLDVTRKHIPFRDVYRAALERKRVQENGCLRPDNPDHWETIRAYVAGILMEVRGLVPDAGTVNWFACIWNEHGLERSESSVGPDEFAAFLDRLMVDDEEGQKAVAGAFYVGCGECTLCQSFNRIFSLPRSVHPERNIMIRSDRVIFNEAQNGRPAVCGYPIPPCQGDSKLVFVVSCENVAWPAVLPEFHEDGLQPVCIRLVTGTSRKRMPPYVIAIRWGIT